ncbi:methyltransferase [Variovorax paradoxus]|uniref:Methyltransferase n=1 Tax=Variovorax paradoxus TaxID=34073 RepID=A0A0D0K9W4_VARPD|nr:class I SAM-dependent methyltransferase [Variovorax paradoxus]KIQ22917.1 methyltransferase [Variovorax paradoxus]
MTLDELNQKFAAVPARHKEVSIIASMDDEPARPSRRLMEVALAASSVAMDVALPIYEGRASKEPHWFDTWPGEHYRLLAALVRSLNPKTVIEIGTFTGMGTLALAQELQPSGTLTTFDLLAWDSFSDTWLAPSDFAAGRVRQVLHDISAPGGIAPHCALFESAELIFVDGPKDGITEANILANLVTLNLSREVVVVFDDIRVVNMIDIWRRIGRPKMDLTSFGHWSGTGLVDWNATSGL